MQAKIGQTVLFNLTTLKVSSGVVVSKTNRKHNGQRVFYGVRMGSAIIEIDDKMIHSVL